MHCCRWNFPCLRSSGKKAVEQARSDWARIPKYTQKLQAVIRTAKPRAATDACVCTLRWWWWGGVVCGGYPALAPLCSSSYTLRNAKKSKQHIIGQNKGFAINCVRFLCRYPLTAKAAHNGALVGFPLRHLSRLLLRVSYARHGMSPPSASVNCALVVPKA